MPGLLCDDLNRFLNAHNVLAASAARLFLYKSICIEQYGFTVNPLFLLKHSETIFSRSMLQLYNLETSLIFPTLNEINKLLLFPLSFDQLREISFHTISTIIVYRIQSIRKSFKCKRDLIVCSCWLIEEPTGSLPSKIRQDGEQEVGIIFCGKQSIFQSVFRNGIKTRIGNQSSKDKFTVVIKDIS